jgi:hypothetical protein
MNISDAAVEAATFAVARNYGSVGSPTNTILWNRLVADVRTALDAAAPHLLAPAASDLEDQDDLVEILKKERWKYVAMKDEDGRPDGGYFEQSNEHVAQAIVRAGFRKVAK